MQGAIFREYSWKQMTDVHYNEKCNDIAVLTANRNTSQKNIHFQ